MCGRFGLFTPESELARELAAEVRAPDPGPRFNIAPTQEVLACRATAPDQRELVALRWGLVPFWSDGPDSAYRMINARAETAADKPAFRAAFRRRRCLIPADGFYEWQSRGPGQPKQPYWFTLAGGGPMAFAGLWEHWEDGEGGVVESCTILVGPPNERIRPVHDRMPIILPPRDWSLWLDPGVSDPAVLRPLLAPFPAEAMAAAPVSRRVNNPGNEGPELIAPVAE